MKYAVAGLNHGLEHVDCITAKPCNSVVALCDINNELLKRAAHKIQGVNKQPRIKTFVSYDELMKWGGFEAIIIAVPPHLHADFTVKAISAGKHVLLEKPVTVTIEDADRIRRAYKGAETVLQVGYEVRCSQLAKKTLEIIKSGKIGDVVFLWWHMLLDDRQRSHSGWRGDRKNCGGKLLDCLPHYFDIISLFAGSRFNRVSAFGNPAGEAGVNPDKIPEVATVNIEYENGAKANISLSEVSPSPEHSLFGIAGSNGVIYGNPWKPEGAGSLDCYTEGCLYNEKIIINGRKASRGHLGFSEQLDAFERAVLNGEPVPCSFEDAYETLILTLSIDKAISTGNTISRKDILPDSE